MNEFEFTIIIENIKLNKVVYTPSEFERIINSLTEYQSLVLYDTVAAHKFKPEEACNIATLLTQLNLKKQVSYLRK